MYAGACAGFFPGVGLHVVLDLSLLVLWYRVDLSKIKKNGVGVDPLNPGHALAIMYGNF